MVKSGVKHHQTNNNMHDSCTSNNILDQVDRHFFLSYNRWCSIKCNKYVWCWLFYASQITHWLLFITWSFLIGIVQTNVWSIRQINWL